MPPIPPCCAPAPPLLAKIPLGTVQLVVEVGSSTFCFSHLST